VQPGRDADHSPRFSAEDEKAQELYLLSPKVPPWHVIGPLYPLFFIIVKSYLVSNYFGSFTPNICACWATCTILAFFTSEFY
jgi:hypothetical protein